MTTKNNREHSHQHKQFDAVTEIYCDPLSVCDAESIAQKKDADAAVDDVVAISAIS